MTGSKQTRLPLTLPVARSNNGAMAKADPEHGPGTPLQNYRAHILSKLLLSAAQLAQLKFRLNNPGWPMWKKFNTPGAMVFY
ncbi:hypothetical protein HBH53_232420 [Parastagonospora nodorum]|nr:hypothetical protein HBH53_232420 [Parastagonospora nodorum]